MTQQFREQPIPHGVGYQQTGRPSPRPASAEYGASGMQTPHYRGAPSSYRASGGGSYGMSRSDEFLNSLTNAAKENPLSAALVGIGVAWLFMGGHRTTLFGLGRGAVTGAAAAGATVGRAGYRAGAAGFEAGRSGIGYAGHAISSGAQGVAGAVGSVASRVGDAAGSAGEYVADAASSAYGRVSEAASGMMLQRGGGEGTGGWDENDMGSSDGEGSRGFSDMMPDMRGSMQNLSGNMQRMSGSVQQNLSELFEKQPLALGAVGLAVGMALGAALPTTEIENQYLGEHSDALRDMAADQFEQAKDKATSALSDAQKYAEEQKLSPDGLREGAEAVVGKVVNVAEAAVKGVKQKVDGSFSGNG